MRIIIVYCVIVLVRAIALGYANQYGGDMSDYLRVINHTTSLFGIPLLVQSFAIAVILDFLDLKAKISQLRASKNKDD